ncbi:phosphatidate cytidylyltransferase [Sulfurimonas sp.]
MFENNKERIVTGVALLAAVIAIGLIDNFYLMWFVFGVIYLLSFKEAIKLFGVEKDNLLPYAVMLWIIAGVYPYGDDLFVLAGVGYASLVAYNKEVKWKDFFPFLYPTAGLLFVFTMYQEYTILSLLWLLAVVALTDIGAYVVGKRIGKTPFCETSPNKTLEGVFGGVAVATIVGAFFGLFVVGFWTSLVISFMVSASSIFGDLFESSLKRSAGVKDSGDLLPGHGGVLDRIDGYLFGGVVMLVLLRGLV